MLYFPSFKINIKAELEIEINIELVKNQSKLTLIIPININ